jgi:hypothetical protein
MLLHICLVFVLPSAHYSQSRISSRNMIKASF